VSGSNVTVKGLALKVASAPVTEHGIGISESLRTCYDRHHRRPHI